VDGGSLQQRIGGKPQPPQQAAELLEPLARAVHAVHQQGIVHRDLKPANVLLTAGGAPKVADFGLAKRLDGGAANTQTGHILGTPSYMAPEQAKGLGRLIGPATDVYALGAILYELLTGRPPFQAKTPWDTILQVTAADPVPPRRLQPTVPPDLETICLKCLQKEQGPRYASAQALAEDLRRFLDGEPIRARPVGPWERAVKWARRRPAAAALLAVSGLALLAGAVGSAVYQARLSRSLADARGHAEESRRRLVRLHVAQGTHALDQGDWLGSLVWFAEALRLDQGDPDREAMHRTRFGAVGRQCPRLVLIGFHDGPVRQARLSPDGRYLLTASEDQPARLWEVRTGEPAAPPLRHDGAVLSAAFRPDGRAAVTAGRDGTARVWEVPSGRALFPPLRHDGPVLCAAFSRDGRRMLTAAEDASARIWDTTTGQLLAGPLPHGGVVRHAAFSPDGGKVVTASADRTARVWDAATGKPAAPPLDHAGPVTWAAFDPDGRRVVTASADRTARLWEADTGKPLPAVLRHRAAVAQASFSPDGRRVLTASDDQTACVWEAATGALLAPAFQQDSGVNAAAFSPDGRWAVTAGDDNTACLWDTATGEWLPPLLNHQGSVQCVAFSPDGRYVVTAGNDNTARVWDVSRRLRAFAPGEGNPPGPAAARGPERWVSPDGRRAVTAERDHSAQVRAADTGEPLGPALRHGSSVLAAAFSPDGRRLVTVSDDNTARVWDVKTGELLAQPLRHKGPVQFAAFSPGGGQVVTASADRTARVWDATTGEPITPALRFADGVRRAAFAADGGRVSLTGTGETVWAWDLCRDDRPVADLVHLAQVLAGSRIDPARGFLPLGPALLRSSWHRLRTEYPDDFALVPRRPEDKP
jgi:WD40 repeat protein